MAKSSAAKHLPREPLIRLYVLLPRPPHNFLRQLAGRAVLVPGGGIEPLAEVLLVEGWLRVAGLGLIGGPTAAAIGSEDFIDWHQLVVAAASAGGLARFKLRVCNADSARESALRSMHVDFTAPLPPLIRRFSC